MPPKPTSASGKAVRAKASATVPAPGSAPALAPVIPLVRPAAASSPPDRRCVRIGIGGPVGAGKTTLVAALCRVLRAEYALAVVTNEPQTREDADFLLSEGVLDPDHVVAVQTGCSPQTAIREDIAANLDAVEALEQRLHPLDLLLVESGGGDLAATFSRGLVDRQIFVFDAAIGARSARKAGPGMLRADLLVVNKTDLAPLVDCDLEAIRRDAGDRRESRPTLFTSLTEHPDAPAVADWIRTLIAERRTLPGRG